MVNTPNSRGAPTVTLLGTGGPGLDPNRHGPSTLISIGEDKLLFDCGRGATLQLYRAGIQAKDLDLLFLTHLHFDHMSDLGDLLMIGWASGRRGPLRIYGPKGTKAVVDALVNVVYEKDIKFRYDLERPVLGNHFQRDPAQMVEVTEVGPGAVCGGADWKVSARYVEHGHGLGEVTFDWFCLGYRIEAAGKVAAVSGDCVPCEGLYDLAAGADALVQCCFLCEAQATSSERAKIANKYILASSIDVGKIAKRCGVKKLVLTHFNERADREMAADMKREARRDFDGNIVLGEDLLEILL